METTNVLGLHKKYIASTGEKQLVHLAQILVCNFTHRTQKEGSFSSRKVYINTKILKHLYDKKPAEEYDFIIHNIITIVKFPDHIYQNKDAKRGDILLVKTLKNKKYACSIEKIHSEDLNEDINFIVTCMRLRKENYLNGYKHIWSWESDISPS